MSEPDPVQLQHLIRDYLAKGRLMEAMVVAKQSVKRFPDLPELHLLLSEIFLARGDRKQARAQLELVLARDPAFPGARAALERLDGCAMITTYVDAQAWLRSQGIETELSSRGLSGELTDSSGSYFFEVGKSSGGGKEVSVRLLPGPLVYWFWSETMDGIAHLLVDARARSGDGRAATWLDALRALDSTMSALWPKSDLPP